MKVMYSRPPPAATSVPLSARLNLYKQSYLEIIMLTVEQVENSEVFQLIQEALKTPGSLVPVIRRAGLKHHASPANTQRKGSGGKQQEGCTSGPIIDEECSDCTHIDELAAFIVRECVGGVLLITCQDSNDGEEKTHFFGNSKDVDAVRLIQKR